MITDIRADDRSSLFFGKMSSALFGRALDVVLYGNDAGYLEYAGRCAEYLENMPPELLAELKCCSLRYCEDMRDYFNVDSPEVPEGVDEDNVLEYARANCLIIERPKDIEVIGFSVEFSCDWEPEHGMEWTIRDGRALYVGDFMGISPWYADKVYQTECRSYVYEGFSL